ncbi:MAG: type II toxin-antitoxin system VapC family toxin [Actinomycetota bacterium]
MPISGSGAAIDTSVAVAALDAAHAAHDACREAVRERRPALAGHAAFETHSVLTRLPGPQAVSTAIAADLIARVFPDVAWLGSEDATALLRRLGVAGVSGGAVYDALVGEAARVNGLVLLTRDRRAQRTYDLLGVDHEFVGP